MQRVRKFEKARQVEESTDPLIRIAGYDSSGLVATFQFYVILEVTNLAQRHHSKFK